jgi:hypothetical protein
VWVQATLWGGTIDLIELYADADLQVSVPQALVMNIDNARWVKFEVPAGQYYLNIGSGPGSAGSLVAVWDVPGPKYNGGFGSEELPFELATTADLLELSTTTNDYGKAFILTDDIDLGGYTFSTALIAADTDPTNPDYDGTAFAGSFNGNGHAIRNLTIDDGGLAGAYLGFFGKISGGAYITGLRVEDVSITVGEWAGFVGALSGWCDDSVEDCRASGAIICGDYALSVGGLIGESPGALYQCRSSVSVSCGDYAWQIGGLAGLADALSQCCASGGVTTGWYADDVGGLAGYVNGVHDSYATGAVTVDVMSMCVGGLAGVVGAQADRCYATGLVSDQGLPSLAGGLIGEVCAVDQPVQCFWDPFRSGMSVSVGGGGDELCTPLSASQASDPTVFTGATWDLPGTWRPTVGWPLLAAFDYADLNGDGVADMEDFTLLVAAVTGPGQPTSLTPADLDGDGDCDVIDLAIFDGCRN